MLHFIKQEGPNLSYTVSGKLSEADLHRYYGTIDGQYRRFGKLTLIATAVDFSGYRGPAALLTFLLNEPTLLGKVANYTLYANQAWLRQLVNGLDVLTPGVRLRAKKEPATLRESAAGGEIG